MACLWCASLSHKNDSDMDGLTPWCVVSLRERIEKLEFQRDNAKPQGETNERCSSVHPPTGVRCSLRVGHEGVHNHASYTAYHQWPQIEQLRVTPCDHSVDAFLRDARHPERPNYYWWLLNSQCSSCGLGLETKP